jgi:hypothetical protein
MSFRVVTLSCDPAQPHAGQSFRLTVELDQNAPSEVKVLLEKQRIVKSTSGALELRPTGPDYFNLDPQPIKVDAGTNSGDSEPIEVRKNAIAQPGEPPVRFPEQLLFTAFGEPNDRFHCLVVPILRPPDAG